MDEGGLLSALLAALGDELEGALGVRRRLRRCPELAGHEFETADTIAEALGDVERSSATGLVAGVGPAGETVAVRAELDAIEVDGTVLHACGHDAHMAALVALVRAARAVERPLPMRLLGVFQPSEEAYPSGAAEMVGSGALGADLRASVAAHAQPELSWGEVGCDPGVVNAASDVVAVTMVGRPGHVAYPRRARNPIGPLASFVAALETGSARDRVPRGCLATVSSLAAGGAENVIPSLARATVALRSLGPAARQDLREAVAEAAAEAAREGGCEATFDLTEGEPALTNDPALADRAAELLARAGLSRTTSRSSFGSDDFAYFGALGPLLMMFVGLDGAPGFRPAGLHDPEFVVPDEAVGRIALVMAAGYCAACAGAGS